MKSIGIQRIEKRLDAFDGLIDVADLVGRPATEQRKQFLSRALAAYCVKMLAGTDDTAAAKSVTDRYHDRGLDAIYYDPRLSRLFVVQSKWSKALEWKECGEFVDGVRKFFSGKWDLFANNKRIHDRVGEFEVALEGASKVILVTVHHGSQPADVATRKRVDDLAAEIDDGSGLVTASHWHQADLLEALKNEADPPKVSAAFHFIQWGECDDPYRAVYGRVQAQAIADLWNANPHLCHLNLREFGRETGVNAAIAKTIKEEPEHFWYFNNGLAFVCDSITSGVMGRPDKDKTIFRFEGLSLVNGAQTAGIISERLEKLAPEERPKVWVQVRVVELKNCDEGFENRVTRFTNLQNPATQQDFVALDPVQSRLAIDLAILHRRYSFKWAGEGDTPSGGSGCDLKEATVGLACAESDPWYAVQAKREIGSFWNVESPRYRQLFNENVTATRLWNAVSIMRQVDAKVQEFGVGEHEKASMVASHLQRIVLHLVFQSGSLADWGVKPDPAPLIRIVDSEAEIRFKQVCDYIMRKHPKEYLASLSKNFEKCRTMVQALTTDPSDPTLFSRMNGK